jgi:hypothetical protein
MIVIRGQLQALVLPASAGSSCAQPVDGAGDPDRLWLQGKSSIHPYSLSQFLALRRLW